jgi:hypothetical protein
MQNKKTNLRAIHALRLVLRTQPRPKNCAPQTAQIKHRRAIESEREFGAPNCAPTRGLASLGHFATVAP